MRERAAALIDELRRQPPPVAAEEIDEVKAFLTWVADDHFTFLGYREYDLVIEDDEAGLKAVPDSGMGILRGTAHASYTRLRPKALSSGARAARARADQGQLACHRPPSRVSRLHRRQAVRARR